MENEIWIEIKGYEGLYQVSDQGRVKSLNYNNTKKEGVMSPSKNAHGYFRLNLWKNKKCKSHKIHQLVAIAFLNHTPCGYKRIIDHIDNNKENNRASNLQITTVRVNVSKDRIGNCKSTGVWYDKSRDKYETRITIEGKRKYLGRYDNEIDASNAYTECLDKFLITK